MRAMPPLPPHTPPWATACARHTRWRPLAKLAAKQLVWASLAWTGAGAAQLQPPPPHTPPSRSAAQMAPLAMATPPGRHREAPGPCAKPTEPELPATVLQALQTAGLPLQALSVWVAPVDAAAPRWQQSAEQPRLAASVMKLFTTGVALRTWGPAHVWHTDLGLLGTLDQAGRLQGHLVLRGEGDPALRTEDLQRWMGRWRAAGLQSVQGDVWLDRSAFDVPAHNPAAFDGQALKPYNAGPDALLLNWQTVTLRLAPDATRPELARATLEPALHGVSVQAQVSLEPQGSCLDWRAGLSLQLQPLDAPAARNAPGLRPWVLRIQGRYPAACDVREWPLLWAGDGPGDHTLRVLLQTWLDLGGEWQGRIQESPWPEGLAVWQRWTSPPLAQLVRDINKFSNNVMARQVFLSLGRTQSERLPPASGATAELANGAQAPRQAATLPRAREAVARQVRADTAPLGALAGPCEGQALQLDNGSGLSRAERTSAACLGRWLQAMWRSSVMPEFVASLPVTGIDGTTRRWRAAEGSAHLKTGSLDGVATLAGYVLGTSGQRHVLVAMVNHPRAEAARPALLALINAVQQAPETHAPDR